MANNRKVLARKLSRRDFLKAAGATGLGLTGLSALPGCAPGATPAPAATPTPEATTAPAATPAPQVAQVNFRSWTYRPDMVQENVDRFNEHYPNIFVDHESIPFDAYIEKILSGFTVGPLADIMYVNEAGAGWVSGGYLRPLDDLPGFDELKADMLPGFIESVVYDGKLYGLPYFVGYHLFHYNEEILETAGISEPPSSLEELKEQCLIIRDKGIAEMPLMANEDQLGAPRTYYDVLYASGGRLFDDEGNPIPIDENKTAVDVLDWLIKAHVDWEIMDPAGLSLGAEEVTKIFMDGKLPFMISWDYQMPRYNNPELSQIAGKGMFTHMPGLGPESQGTWGQGWYYGLAAATKELDAAWEFMRYMGGKDWEGEYYVAKRWAREEGLLFGYDSMYKDPEVQESLKAYRDLGLLSEILAGGRPMENFKVPWFLEWFDFVRVAYQEAVSGTTSAEEALQGVLNKAAELKAG